MALHMPPLSDAAAETAFRRVKVSSSTHVLTTVAIGITALAAGAYLALERGVDPMLAIAGGLAILVAGVSGHLALTQSATLMGTGRRKREHDIGDAIEAAKFAEPERILERVLASSGTRATAPVVSATVVPTTTSEATPGAAQPSHAVEPSALAIALLENAARTSQVASVSSPGPVIEAGSLDAPRAIEPSWATDLARHVPKSDRMLDVLPTAPQALASLSRTAALDRIDSPMGAPDESEFQRVERLVRQLADSVNRRDAGQAAPSLLDQLSLFPDSSQAGEQLAASIHALKRTASADPVPPALPPMLGWPGATQPRDVQPEATDPASRATLQTAILSALNAQRIAVYVEPILGLADQRPQHYEVSIALQTPEGSPIDLADAGSDLSGTGLLPLIDQVRIQRAAAMARTLAGRGKLGAVFADVTDEAIGDRGFQQSFTDDTRTMGAFPGQLVLTLTQAHVATFTAADWQTVARLRAAGFAFALADVTSLDMDFEALAAAGFTFARLDAETFLIGLPLADGMVAPDDICRHLAGCGLGLIVGGIFDDQQLARIFGFGVLFGQGQLFGGPRQVKAAVTASVAVAAE